MVQQALPSPARNRPARLLCEKAAWTIDQHGNRAAHLLVSQIKACGPADDCDVIDRAIQVHGAAGSARTRAADCNAWQRAWHLRRAG